MDKERPFNLRTTRGFNEEIKDEAFRLSLIPDMNRETLLAARDWPDCQPKVKSAINRRLKQFDAWGYDVIVEYNNGKPSETLTIPGTRSAVRRKAMYKHNVQRVVSIGDPITREAWIAAYGDGKTRM